MKTLLFAFILSSLVFSVGLENIPKDVMYVEIVGTKLITKLSISVDYGQHWKDKKPIRKNGKQFVFNSMVEALNFMNKNGWEHVDAYSISQGNTTYYHYLLKRKQ